MSCCALHRLHAATKTSISPPVSNKTQLTHKPLRPVESKTPNHREQRELVINATIYTADKQQPLFENGWLAFEGGTIVAMGDQHTKAPYSDNVFDASGKCYYRAS